MDWLPSLGLSAESYFLVGSLVTAGLILIVNNVRWTGTFMGPVTRRLLSSMGWKGLALSMGLSLVPDLLHAPIGAVKGLKKKVRPEKDSLQRIRKTKTEAMYLSHAAEPIGRPKNLREAMLNALLRNEYDNPTLYIDRDTDTPRVNIELSLSKEDTPWLI